MAEKETQELPAPPAAGGGGGLNAWMPVLVVVILMPVLTFVMIQFLLLPKMKAMFTEVAAAQAGGEGDVTDVEGKHGEAAAAPSHGGKKGEHGGEGGGGSVFELTDVVTNLSGTMQSRYLKVSLMIEGSGEGFAEVMKSNKARLLDASLSVLSSLTLQDLEDPGIKNVVRSDLLAAYASAVPGVKIKQIFFAEFVVQ